MCFEFKFVPFHHPRFCQSLITFIFYVKSDNIYCFFHLSELSNGNNLHPILVKSHRMLIFH